jgi:carbamoyltransferase
MLKFERLLETYIAFAPSGFRSFSMAIRVWLREKLMMRRMIRGGLPGKTSAPMLFMDHHESHAASAFFRSPFEEAAILRSTASANGRAQPGAWEGATK